jgi:hypothetical protein
MYMSETISNEEQKTEQTGVVELGTASEQTRGSPALLGILDGGVIWPLIFWSRG